MIYFNKWIKFLILSFFFFQKIWAQIPFIETENKTLSKNIEDYFEDTDFSLSKLNQFLLKNKYYLSEVIQKEDKIIIKNPYQIIFVIQGNHFLTEKEIRNLLKIDENKMGPFFYSFIENEIQLAYNKKGFFKISIEKKETQRAWNKWYYLSIDEGNRLSLGDLKVVGLLSRSFSFYEDIILKNSLELTKGFFTQKALDEAQRNLINTLKNEGYLQAQIYSVRKFFKENEIFVTIRLGEGPLSFVKDIKIEGVKTFALWEILSQMKTHIQSQVKVDVIKEDLKRIESFYKKRGYFQMQIKNKQEVIKYIDGSKDVSLNIEIEEGPVYVISQIKYKGLKNVKEYLVKSLLEFKEGDFFTEEKREKSLQNLAGTGLFTNININEKVVNEQLEVDVLFQEKKNRSLKGGLGLNSQRNLTTRVYTELTHRNLFGWGQAFILRGSGQMSFTQARPFLEFDISTRYKEVFIPGWKYEGDLNLSHSKNIFRYSKENINYVKKTLLSFFVNKKVTDLLNLRWTVLSFENRREYCTVFNCDTNTQRISSTSFQTIYDTRNNIFSPSKGYLLSYMVEWASPFLGSSLDIAFLKLDFHNYFYLSFFKDYTLSFVFKSGFISNLQSSNNMPVSRSFILGGQSSLRAYDGNIEGERLPRKKHVPIETANEALMLKQEKVLKSQYNLLKLDFRFPIFEGFKAILFYDLGSVFLKSKNQELLDYGHSVGVGIRYQTFLIPIGLDIAFQLPPRECISVGEGNCTYSRFHFSIGW
ncbi:MAG: BamA/TamA family outer membrane protein [Bdellovibrionales bacterium]|nr:BamA/TamA family outer membrane protein [Bdellovibrionales bacterium]